MKKTDPHALVEKVTENMTLSIFRIGCDKTNYLIIKSLPSDIKHLQKLISISKMPINRRVNELADVGLLEREKYTGKVNPTSLSESFVGTIENIKQKVVIELPNLI